MSQELLIFVTRIVELLNMLVATSWLVLWHNCETVFNVCRCSLHQYNSMLNALGHTMLYYHTMFGHQFYMLSIKQAKNVFY